MEIDLQQAFSKEIRWTVTQVLAQIDEMAGSCNELQANGHTIRFIVPMGQVSYSIGERPLTYIAIFSTKASCERKSDV